MGEAAKLRVFLSYARRDGAALADELHAGLELLGFEPILDRQDIAAAEDWEHRLVALIRQADTVVFLLSPASVASERCAWEVDRAIALSKRLVPVIVATVPESDIPPPLARLNFVDFAPGKSFARSLGALADALRVDLDWIREHTRLAELAQRWIERHHDDALLLRGAELAAAQLWQAAWHAGAPGVTDRQRQYIAAAAEAEARREAHERWRIEEMAQANASRAEALQLREAAMRSLKRRTLIGAGGAVALSAGGGVLAVLYAHEAQQREKDRAVTEEALKNSAAAAVRREALRTDLEGQMVVYATAPGRPASDDSGLSAELVEALRSPAVPLGTAVSRVVRRVLDKTGGMQRPYVSTDLSGDVYFRLAPPSRSRHALVISVDRLANSVRLPGVLRDAQIWDSFFRECGFAVTWLKNPGRDEVLAALTNVKMVGLGVPSEWTVRTGALAPPGAASAAVAQRPRPNSFFVFYFGGGGVRLNGADCLSMIDTGYSPATSSAPPDASTLLTVTEVSESLRRSVAASCLILDTNFPSYNDPKLKLPIR